MSPTVYLVSGANRGLGLGLAKTIAKRNDVVVFAGARQPDAASDLHALAKEYPGKLHIVKLTSADEADNRAAIDEIKKIAGRLDVVVANAAIANSFLPVSELPLDAMREHFEVNTLGTLALFQAAYPLMKASTPTPKFIPISSGASSVAFGPTVPLPNTAFGASKAALNFVTRKMRAENDGLICFPICPGAVKSKISAPAHENPKEDLGGLVKKWQEPEVVAVDILKRIDEATRETDVFMQFDGTTWQW